MIDWFDFGIGAVQQRFRLKFRLRVVVEAGTAPYELS
jgi:hypothetical protein